MFLNAKIIESIIFFDKDLISSLLKSVSKVLIVWISFDQVDELEPETLDLGLLILESHIDFFDLLFDQAELLVG